MSVLKAAGTFLIAVFCGLMGIAFQNDMKQRILLLQDFHRGILLLHQEIAYLKFPLEEAVQHAGCTLREPLLSFFCEMGKQLENMPDVSFFAVWETMEERYLKKTALKTADLELIRQLGSQLGQPETGSSDGLLKVYEQRVEMALEEAQNEYKEKAQLYKRLGIMGGIFLVILLL